MFLMGLNRALTSAMASKATLTQLAKFESFKLTKQIQTSNLCVPCCKTDLQKSRTESLSCALLRELETLAP